MSAAKRAPASSKKARTRLVGLKRIDSLRHTGIIGFQTESQLRQELPAYVPFPEALYPFKTIQGAAEQFFCLLDIPLWIGFFF
jgi:hypothetical protein